MTVPISLKCLAASALIEPRQPDRLLHAQGKLVLLFTSLLAIPLARQGRLHTALLTWLQVVGVTLHFLDDVLLLHFPLESPQRVFQRFAFLYTNFCQLCHTS